MRIIKKLGIFIAKLFGALVVGFIVAVVAAMFVLTGLPSFFPNLAQNTIYLIYLGVVLVSYILIFRTFVINAPVNKEFEYVDSNIDTNSYNHIDEKYELSQASAEKGSKAMNRLLLPLFLFLPAMFLTVGLLVAVIAFAVSMLFYFGIAHLSSSSGSNNLVRLNKDHISIYQENLKHNGSVMYTEIEDFNIRIHDINKFRVSYQKKGGVINSIQLFFYDNNELKNTNILLQDYQGMDKMLAYFMTPLLKANNNQSNLI